MLRKRYCALITGTKRGCGSRCRRATAAALLVGAGGLALVASAAAQGDEPVLYGDTFLLSGTVEEGGAGEVVVVVARRHGQAAFAEVGRTRTTRGGRWAFRARPSIRTVYRARAGTALSAPVVVDVEPRITLRSLRGTFAARVRAARSFSGRFVILQRRTTGAWRDVRRLVLDSSSATRFTFGPVGTRTQIRLSMPRSQVGPGYVAARSPVFTLLRP